MFDTHSESIVAACSNALKNEVVAAVKEVKDRLEKVKYDQRLQRALLTPKKLMARSTSY